MELHNPFPENFGILELNVYEAAKLIVISLYADGEIENSKVPEKDWVSLYDTEIEKALQKEIKAYQKTLIQAINNGTLRAKPISRNIKEEIIPEETYINSDVLHSWLEARNVFLGEVFTHDYLEFEQSLWVDALEYVECQKKKRQDDAFRGKLRDYSDKSPEFEKLMLDNERLTLENLELKRGKASQDTPKELSPKQYTSHMNIIGSLLTLLLGKDSKGKKYSLFRTQEDVIDTIYGFYPKTQGLSKRNLEGTFAEAQRHIRYEGDN